MTVFGLIHSCSGDTGLDKILRTEEMLENITVLTTDLLFKLNPGHCYTVITDPLYQEVLVPKLFRDIGHSAYFVVKVPFNEDMLWPNLHIQITLQEARKAGCRCYLMYLANGIQMERFLRFVDRYVRHTAYFPRIRSVQSGIQWVFLDFT